MFIGWKYHLSITVELKEPNTAILQAGYVGEDVESILQKLLAVCFVLHSSAYN